MDAAERRQLGSYYTPPAIARWMVGSCLEARHDTDDGLSTLRVLDPACGDGVFLLAAFQALARACVERYANDRNRYRDRLVRSGSSWMLAPQERLRIFREQVFGVDVDPAAIAGARARLVERLSHCVSDASAVEEAVSANIVLGDALTGADFNEPSARAVPSEVPAAVPHVAGPLDWRRAFPAAAGQGGFDLIIGNPPYLREKDAKDIFDRIAATDFGRRWRQARMDLWFYFVHRSLDLLRPGGTLSFIVNSYWTASSGAKKMIDRLRLETEIQEIVRLNDEPVFANVTGRHLVFRLIRKASDAQGEPASCRVRSLNFPPEAAADAGELRRRNELQWPEEEVSRENCCLTPDELFQGGRLVLTPLDGTQAVFAGCRPLGDFYETRQGMAENPPTINDRLAREFDGLYCKGEGVFVLTAAEVEQLQLSPDERRLLRPYFTTSKVGRYRLPAEPQQWVLYLSRATAPTSESIPRILRHLARFRPILDRRRETQQGSNEWWHLHWPREESIFTQPRVLSVQMGAVPQFVYAEQPTFVGFSVNLILARDDGFPLPVLTAILNSSRAASWFDRHAKRRGVKLDINAGVLREFPLPGRDPAVEGEIALLVVQRQQQTSESTSALDERLNKLVDRLYSRLSILL